MSAQPAEFNQQSPDFFAASAATTPSIPGLRSYNGYGYIPDDGNTVAAAQADAHLQLVENTASPDTDYDSYFRPDPGNQGTDGLVAYPTGWTEDEYPTAEIPVVITGRQKAARFMGNVFGRAGKALSYAAPSFEAQNTLVSHAVTQDDDSGNEVRYLAAADQASKSVAYVTRGNLEYEAADVVAAVAGLPEGSVGALPPELIREAFSGIAFDGISINPSDVGLLLTALDEKLFEYRACSLPTGFSSILEAKIHDARIAFEGGPRLTAAELADQESHRHERAGVPWRRVSAAAGALLVSTYALAGVRGESPVPQSVGSRPVAVAPSHPKSQYTYLGHHQIVQSHREAPHDTIGSIDRGEEQPPLPAVCAPNQELHLGQTIWGHVRDCLKILHLGSSNPDIRHETQIVLNDDHITWAGARKLRDRFKFKMELPSLRHHYTGKHRRG